METHRVAITEFWRLVYDVRAADPLDAVRRFKSARKLPEPERLLLGRIEEPEQVSDSSGNLLYSNQPPADDAEKMLFIEIWRRLQADHAPWHAIAASIDFVSVCKGWNADDLVGEVIA